MKKRLLDLGFLERPLCESTERARPPRMKVDAPHLAFGARGLELERLERHVVEPCRFFVRQCVGRTIARASCVVDRFVGDIGRRGLNEVVGQIREWRIGPSLRQTFDRLAHAPVEPYATCRRQFPVQRLANERVHKAEPAGSNRRFGDQLRLNPFVDGVEEAIFRRSPSASRYRCRTRVQNRRRLSVRLHACSGATAAGR